MSLRVALFSSLLVIAVMSMTPGPAAQEASSPDGTERAGLTFEAFLSDVRREALARGLREETVSEALDGVRPVEQVLQRDRSQAEFTLTLDQYLARRVDPGTVRTARTMARRYRTWLGRAEEAFGVDARIIVAIWGLESNFGRFSGVRPMIPTLATLGWDNRRGEFFRGQLLDALTILDREYISLPRMKGSWAGAMGQVQFLPSSYLAWAVDFDEDGDRDIWSSLPDVFGSIGHYLQAHGWAAGIPWGFEVAIPAATRPVIDGLAVRQEGCRASRMLTMGRPLDEWRADGLTLEGGKPIPAGPELASLVRIESRAFLVTRNYEALLAYNCAHTYALSVGLLSDRAR